MHGVCSLYGPMGAACVDMHRWVIHCVLPWNRVQRRITEAVWERAETLEWAGARVRVPAPVDSLLVGLVLQRCWGDRWLLKPHDALDFRLITERLGDTLSDGRREWYPRRLPPRSHCFVRRERHRHMRGGKQRGGSAYRDALHRALQHGQTFERSHADDGTGKPLVGQEQFAIRIAAKVPVAQLGSKALARLRPETQAAIPALHDSRGRVEPREVLGQRRPIGAHESPERGALPHSARPRERGGLSVSNGDSRVQRKQTARPQRLGQRHEERRVHCGRAVLPHEPPHGDPALHVTRT